MIRHAAWLATTPRGRLVTLAGLVPAGHAGAATPRVTARLPGTTAAAAGGPAGRRWLAGQFTPRATSRRAAGSTSPTSPPPPQSVLALSAANVDLSVARTGLAYLQAHVDQYVTVDGADGPGQLALLILDAEALGAEPRSFGGSDLVTRLLATEQTSGPDAGLFGTEAQVAAYAAGGYKQGLALAALAAAGVTGTGQVARPSAGWWPSSAPTVDGPAPTTPSTRAAGRRPTFAGPGHQLDSAGRRGPGRPGRASTRPSADVRSPSSPPARTPTPGGRTTRTPRPRRSDRPRLDGPGDPGAARPRRLADRAGSLAKGRPPRCRRCSPSS